MFLKILGMNHNTAPVELREQVAFDGPRLGEALIRLGEIDGISEHLILSTCNRTEIYFVSNQSDEDEIVQGWLAKECGLETTALSCLYNHTDSDAIRHAFNVASGLDSMVLGETQILGQLKDAYRTANDLNTVGPLLNRVLQQTFAVAKQVRTQTKIGANAVSVASAAVQLARQVFSSFHRHTALLVGAGDTIEITARHLHTHKIGRMIIANRSIQRARELAKEFGAYAIDLNMIPNHLQEAELVVCSTASPEPILTYDMVKNATSTRRHRPVLMIDIAVPRDVEASVSKLEDVYLYTVDDLKNVIDQNVKSREKEATDAKDIVNTAVEEFRNTLQSLNAVPIIRGVREQADLLRVEVLDQAMRQLESGKDPKEVLEKVSNMLTNKLLHTPSKALRSAGEAGDAELLALAKKLFGLK